MNARRTLLVVAGVVVVGLVVAKWTGVFPPKGGMEGAIGAAKRYQTEQVSPADVELQDADLQAFIQSDIFHDLATDAVFRNAVASEPFQRAVKSGELANARQQLGDEVLGKLAKKTTYEKVSQVFERSPNAADALSRFQKDAELSRHFTVDELSKLSTAKDAVQRLNSPEMLAARKVIDVLGAKAEAAGALEKVAGTDVAGKTGKISADLNKTSAVGTLEKAGNVAETQKVSTAVDLGRVVRVSEQLGKLQPATLNKVFEESLARHANTTNP